MRIPWGSANDVIFPTWYPLLENCAQDASVLVEGGWFLKEIIRQLPAHLHWDPRDKRYIKKCAAKGEDKHVTLSYRIFQNLEKYDGLLLSPSPHSGSPSGRISINNQELFPHKQRVPRFLVLAVSGPLNEGGYPLDGGRQSNQVDGGPIDPGIPKKLREVDSSSSTSLLSLDPQTR